MNSAEQKKIYIVHGYQASPNDHWFPWLGRKLQLAGHQSKRVMLAESNQPNFENWQKFLSVQIPNLDENTIIVAHDLGCLAVLHYLTARFKTTGGNIKAGIFVAGFKAPLNSTLELNEFVQQAKLDSAVLQRHMPLALSLFSSNDPIVPPPLSLQLGHFLNAQTYEIKQAGHFLQEHGYDQFQEIWELMKPLLNA